MRTTRTPLAIALAAGTAALIAGCGGDSTTATGSSASGHRYSIDLTVNSIAGNICKWAETDHGSLVVTVSSATHTGTVSSVTNVPAAVTLTSCNSTCTEVLLSSTANGPIDIETVHGVAEEPTSRQVTVSYDATIQDPPFRDTCGSSVTTLGGTAFTVSTYLQFIDSGASQDVQYVDPVTGQSAHMVVTPIPL
jgi:hypothetical protein